MSMKISSDIVGNRARDLPVCNNNNNYNNNIVAKAMCSGINLYCFPDYCVLWQCAGRQRPTSLSRVNPTIAEGDPQWLCLLFSGINKGSRNGGFIVCERDRKGFEGNFIEVQNTGRK